MSYVPTTCQVATAGFVSTHTKMIHLCKFSVRCLYFSIMVVSDKIHLPISEYWTVYPMVSRSVFYQWAIPEKTRARNYGHETVDWNLYLVDIKKNDPPFYVHIYAWTFDKTRLMQMPTCCPLVKHQRDNRVDSWA